MSVEKLPEVDDADDIIWGDFDYPIGAFFTKEGSWSYEPILDEEESEVPVKVMLDYNQFEKVYYFRPGENDSINWTFLVKHKNGYFIFFDAGCDYTGFDCQGGGSITYSLDGEKMWSLGLTDDMKSNILKLQQ